MLNLVLHILQQCGFVKEPSDLSSLKTFDTSQNGKSNNEDPGLLNNWKTESERNGMTSLSQRPQRNLFLKKRGRKKDVNMALSQLFLINVISVKFYSFSIWCFLSSIVNKNVGFWDLKIFVYFWNLLEVFWNWPCDVFIRHLQCKHNKIQFSRGKYECFNGTFKASLR